MANRGLGSRGEELKWVVITNMVMLILCCVTFGFVPMSLSYDNSSGVFYTGDPPKFNVPLLLMLMALTYFVVIYLFLWLDMIIVHGHLVLGQDLPLYDPSAPFWKVLLKDNPILIAFAFISYVVLLSGAFALTYKLVLTPSFGGCFPYLPNVHIHPAGRDGYLSMEVVFSNPGVTVSYQDLEVFIARQVNDQYFSTNTNTTISLDHFRLESTCQTPLPLQVNVTVVDSAYFDVTLHFRINCIWPFNKLILGNKKQAVVFQCKQFKLIFPSNATQKFGDEMLSCSGFYFH